ncbi:hypothetical protein LJR220_003363 [Bradyrhizobium sp. LjRoot220]|uniref:hypothetical protein n=1 Tax=Bradyrhizobium sp. LjRoot220 TaxID=3342284 RepID=UPI003ECDFE92
MGSKRGALVEAYLGALEAKPLLILTGPTAQPAKISFEKSANLDVFAALWFAKPAHAELVLMRCRDDLTAIGAARPQGWFDMSAREILDALVNTAAQLGATWRTADLMKADAERAVDLIVNQVEAQRKSGGLAQVNAEYKVYRQRQVERGQKAIPYSAHLHAFTTSLVVLAAANASAR